MGVNVYQRMFAIFLLLTTCTFQGCGGGATEAKRHFKNFEEAERIHRENEDKERLLCVQQRNEKRKRDPFVLPIPPQEQVMERLWRRGSDGEPPRNRRRIRNPVFRPPPRRIIIRGDGGADNGEGDDEAEDG